MDGMSPVYELKIRQQPKNARVAIGKEKGETRAAAPRHHDWRDQETPWQDNTNKTPKSKQTESLSIPLPSSSSTFTLCAIKYTTLT